MSCSDSPTDAAAFDDLGKSDGSPVQPKLQKYAPKQYGIKQRDFQSTWYSARPWLEFSMSAKAAFYYCCRHFSNNSDPHLQLQNSPTGSMHWKRTKASPNMLHPVYTFKQWQRGKQGRKDSAQNRRYLHW